MSFKHAVTFTIAMTTAVPALAQPPVRPTVPDELIVPGGVRPTGNGPAEAMRTPADPGPLLELEPLLSAQDRERERQEREEERKNRAREREIELYDRGMDATYEGRYDRALSSFTSVAEMKGARADGALYWKAYSHNKLGQRSEALTTLAELGKAYPSSRYLKQAKALEFEIRNATGQSARPESQVDEDMKLIAIQSLQHSSPEEAIPLLEQILEGTSSPRVKARALFVLALSDTPRAREILKNIAMGRSTPELQSRAIQYLGVHGGAESRAALAEVYAASSDVDIKRRILRAFMVAGEKNRLLAAAQSEKDPELRAAAVEQLGVMGADDALWQLYQKESSLDVKKRILRAMFVGGNATRLIELARTEQNPELRLSAVRNLGIMGSKAAGDALVDIYNTDKDPAVRKAVLQALFIQGNSTALVGLARKEQDQAMKKAIVEKLSLMSDKVARAYMLELLK
jgi:HEAT repeat protein